MVLGSNTSGHLFDTTFTADGILYADGSGVVTSTTAGTAGQVLTSNGPGVAPTYQAGGGGFSPNSTINIFDDFIGGTVITADDTNPYLVSELVWLVTGALSTTADSPTNTNPGVIFTPAGGFGMQLEENGGSAFLKAGGAISCNWVFKINNLSDGTNRYTLNFGLASDSFGQMITFEYSDNVNSGNYRVRCIGGATTTNNTTTAATTTGYHNFGITINSAGTSVAFTVDGVAVTGSPIATNISALALSPFFLCIGSVGTVPDAAFAIDLMYLTKTLTVAR